jgi:hypothetical protein
VLARSLDNLVSAIEQSNELMKKKRNSKDCFKFKEGRAGAFGLWSFGYGSDVSETGCVEACKLVDWNIFCEELGWRLSLSDLHR